MTAFEHDITALVGEMITAEPVTAFFAALDADTQVTPAQDDGPRWVSYASGLEVQTEPPGIITTVFMFAEASQEPGQLPYPGRLPFDLSFSMDRARVREQVMAPPSKEGPAHCAWDFDDHRLVVQYRRDGLVNVVGITARR